MSLVSFESTLNNYFSSMQSNQISESDFANEIGNELSDFYSNISGTTTDSGVYSSLPASGVGTIQSFTFATSVFVASFLTELTNMKLESNAGDDSIFINGYCNALALALASSSGTISSTGTYVSGTSTLPYTASGTFIISGSSIISTCQTLLTTTCSNMRSSTSGGNSNLASAMASLTGSYTITATYTSGLIGSGSGVGS